MGIIEEIRFKQEIQNEKLDLLADVLLHIYANQKGESFKEVSKRFDDALASNLSKLLKDKVASN